MGKKRAPGHPPLDDDDPSVPVHVKMPSHIYDVTFARARRSRVSVPEQMRRDMQTAQALDDAATRPAPEKRNPK